jgi:hypothetical protein
LHWHTDDALLLLLVFVFVLLGVALLLGHWVGGSAPPVQKWVEGQAPQTAAMLVLKNDDTGKSAVE